MKRRTFLVRAAVVAAALGGGLWLKETVLSRKVDITFSGGSQWIPMVAGAAPLPVIEAVIGGVKVRALVDTGAQYSVVDQQLASQWDAAGLDYQTFDMPMIAYGVGGATQVGRGVVVPLEMAGLSVAVLRTAVLDLGPLSTGQGLAVQLIIGRDLLAGAVFELDSDAEKIRFSDPRKWQPAPYLKGAIANLVNDALVAEVRVEGKLVRAVVDTGASSLLSVSQKTADDIGLADGRPRTEGRSLVLGGVTTAHWVPVSRIQFGPRAWRNVSMPIYAASPLPNYPDALLGMGAFEGQKMAVDMGLGRLYVSGQLDLTIG